MLAYTSSHTIEGSASRIRAPSALVLQSNTLKAPRTSVRYRKYNTRMQRPQYASKARSKPSLHDTAPTQERVPWHYLCVSLANQMSHVYFQVAEGTNRTVWRPNGPPHMPLPAAFLFLHFFYVAHAKVRMKSQSNSLPCPMAVKMIYSEPIPESSTKITGIMLRTKC